MRIVFVPPKGELQRMRGDAKRQSGVALMLSVFLLLVLAMLALSSLETMMRNAQVIGGKTSSEVSLQMADAAVAQALDFLFNAYDPVDTPEIGDKITLAAYSTTEYVSDGEFKGGFDPQGSYESEGGTYRLATSIELVAMGEPCLTLIPAHHYGVWDIHVEGISPGGMSISTVHASALVCQCTDPGGCG